ncbi:MAG TPA: FHA domain-containing protein [Candidatus Baltobacteraceae bacterium]|jgi:pSer/pThr/pTyr-binding forkhead associated (FHA) protein|nr:FHA domain-containing protein [Candidatus Baltobacteraceae bacterium]
MSATYILEVLSGPLDGKTWPFESEIVIGRDETLADACITLDRYVSRRHARLRSAAGTILLCDLQSRNGTRIEDRAVTEEEPLEIGTPFQVGRTVLRVTKR